MSKEDNRIVINEETDYTTSALVDFLNNKYGGKKTGKPFTLGDMQQYLRRGFLPRPYGHHPIERVENQKVGIKLIRVNFEETVKSIEEKED